MEQRYKEIDASLIDKLSPSLHLLVITATEVEERVLHEHMKPLNGQDRLIAVAKGKSTYYLGEFGAYSVVHVACGEMGSSGRNASIVTAIDAINTWQPKAVLMVGIAFAADERDHSIGDVLVSERIVNYEPKRLGAETDVPRGKEGPASSLLVNRFKSVKGWNHEVKEGRIAKVFTGLILSGEKLVDNPEEKKQLLEDYPTAIGGEMEGAGIYAACDQKVNDWILVKGVCDFADGNKNTNKKENQQLAITSAVSLSEYVLNSPSALRDLGIAAADQVIPIDALAEEVQTPGGLPRWMKLHAKSLKKDIHENQ